MFPPHRPGRQIWNPALHPRWPSLVDRVGRMSSHVQLESFRARTNHRKCHPYPAERFQAGTDCSRSCPPKPETSPPRKRHTWWHSPPIETFQWHTTHTRSTWMTRRKIRAGRLCTGCPHPCPAHTPLGKRRTQWPLMLAELYLRDSRCRLQNQQHIGTNRLDMQCKSSSHSQGQTIQQSTHHIESVPVQTHTCRSYS